MAEEGFLDSKFRILEECHALDGVMSDEDMRRFEIEWLKYLKQKMTPIHGMKLRLADSQEHGIRKVFCYDAFIERVREVFPDCRVS